MPDVFLSYNREDQPVARLFAEALAQQGFDVWWDATLRSGEAYDQVTEKALKQAKAVVVLWSKKSVDSRWVRAEATLADRNKTLVPAMIEACDRPIMFELTQTADLSHWRGEGSDKTWLAFLDDLRRFVDARGTPAPAAPASAGPAIPTPPSSQVSIAVLPFANMSGDAEQEYFSDGISEDIITDLSKVSALAVISRNSSFTFKGKHVDLPQVARQLQVTHVLEGSVRRAGNRVRITAQLIHGATNNHVWAERYDRELADIFELQDEISKAIVQALKVKLFPQEKRAIEEGGTTNLQAHDKYLRAQALVRLDDGSVPAADLFREALALDPGFAEARIGLIHTYIHQMVFAPLNYAQTLRNLEKVVDEGRAQAGSNWATHAASGLMAMLRGGLLTADAEFCRMKPLVPSSMAAGPWLFGMFLGGVGRIEEAIAQFLAARTADPLSLAVSAQVQMSLHITGRLEEAAAEYERTLELVGNRHPIEHAAVLRLWDGGDIARTRMQACRFHDHEVYPFPVLDQLFELLDQPEAARALLERTFDDPANQNSTFMMTLGWYAALLGHPELALAASRRCYVEMNGTYRVPLWFPFMKAMRQTAGFKQLVRDLGYEDYWRKGGNWGDFARPLGADDFEIYR